MARFSPFSLLIDIDDEYWTPESLVLRAPAKINPEKSRVIFHETLHFWQQCSQTFLVKMVEENWERLKTYENTTKILPVGSTSREYRNIYPEYGYSARDLHEGLARYWDVHVINPVTLMDIEIKDEKRNIPSSVANQYQKYKSIAAAFDPSGYPAAIYDLAMSFTAGDYAKPYINLKEATSSYNAAVLFPLAGHFALQSDWPVPFFEELVKRASPAVMGSERPDAKLVEVWPIWYHRIRNHAVELHREKSERPFYPASVIMENGPLADHPVYYYVVHLLSALINQISMKTEAREYLVPGYENVPSMQAKFSVDFYTACPGIPKFRTFLVSYISPPCIRFSDNKTWKLRLTHLKETYPDMEQEEEVEIESGLQQVVEQVLDLEERWRKFRLAKLGITEV